MLRGQDSLEHSVWSLATPRRRRGEAVVPPLPGHEIPRASRASP